LGSSDTGGPGWAAASTGAASAASAAAGASATSNCSANWTLGSMKRVTAA
jgi:hypothetical protein